MLIPDAAIAATEAKTQESEKYRKAFLESQEKLALLRSTSRSAKIEEALRKLSQKCHGMSRSDTEMDTLIVQAISALALPADPDRSQHARKVVEMLEGWFTLPLFEWNKKYNSSSLPEGRKIVLAEARKAAGGGE